MDILILYSSNDIISSFSYYALDGITNQQSLEAATISIIITHVDKPPIPTTNLPLKAIAGTYNTITITGTDPDSEIISATIKSIPKYGKFFEIYANGTNSKQSLDMKKTIVLTQKPFTISYFYM